jgi:dolichol-phosphate mannosyltransferase
MPPAPLSADRLTLSILMPVRNEGVNFPVILKILSAVLEAPHEILVIYDEPDDDTVPVVRELQARCPNVRLVHNGLGRGVANAIRTGVREAQGDYVLIFAVDDTGPVLAIDQMLALMDRGCDLVSCTRYAGGGRRLGGSRLGGLLSRIANGWFRRLTGTLLTDATTGIKMVRRSALQQLGLETATASWVVAFELAIKAQLAGWRVGEVPIVSIDRLFGGQSTFALGPWLKEYLRWFLWGVRQFRRAEAARQPLVTGERPVDDAVPPVSPLHHAAR